MSVSPLHPLGDPAVRETAHGQPVHLLGAVRAPLEGLLQVSI